VAFESQRALFGRRFRFNVRAETAALRDHGVRVAMVSHGSDIRLPSRHAEREPFSPFRDSKDPLTQTLERSVRKHVRTLEEVQAVEMVSTPDLLLDRPVAAWLPVVVEPAQWWSDNPLLVGPNPKVLHAPSRAGLKGTDAIRRPLEALDRAGVISYRELTGIPSSMMAAEIVHADVVVDQVALGSYGVAACEAMAAGRLVVGHVSGQVRDHILVATGVPLPIIEATPLTLSDVLADIADRPDHYRRRGLEGQQFVERVHDGRFSSEVLRGFLQCR
jgi:hypothetical protein